MRVASLAIALSVVALAAAPSVAQTLAGGTLSFRYDQFPFGSYNGSFQADGELTNLDGFPEVEDNGCAAFVVDHPGLHLLVIVAGHGNTDGSADVAVLAIRSDSPIVPGPYPIDLENYTVAWGFVNDLPEPSFPSDPASADWVAWLEALTANGVFGSANGGIVISAIDDHHVAGSFDGLLTDLDGTMLLLVTQSSFDIGTTVLGVEDSSWADLKALHR